MPENARIDQARTSRRLAVALALILAALGLMLAGAASPAAAIEWTDWDLADADANRATGVLAGARVTLTGNDIQAGDFQSNNFRGFADPVLHQPPLELSESVPMASEPGYRYVIEFAAPIQDPVIHLTSVASVLTFEVPVTRVSGDETFTVAGNVVRGTNNDIRPQPNNDSNGTIRLTGTFTRIAFGAERSGERIDGFFLQVGGTLAPGVPPPPPPQPVVQERNVTRPTIEFYALSQTTKNGVVYVCRPGTWEGLSTDPLYTVTWWQPLPVTRSLTARGARKQVGTGPTYAPPERTAAIKVYCQVDAVMASFRTLSAYSDTTVLAGRIEGKTVIDGIGPEIEYGDVRLRGIDVVQVAQPRSGAAMYGYTPGATGTTPFPLSCGGGTPTEFIYDCGAVAPADPTRTRYVGVPLDQRKPTAALVFVDMRDRRTTETFLAVDVTLTAYLGTRKLDGALTQTIRNPEPTSTFWVTAQERVSTPHRVRFDIPEAWLALAVLSGDPLSLEAQVSLPAAAGRRTYIQCALRLGGVPCNSNDRFRVDDVTVVNNLPDLTVRSVPLLADNQTVAGRPAAGAAVLAAPETVLARGLQLFPGGERISVLPYAGMIDIGNSNGTTTGPAEYTLADDQCKPWVPKADPTASPEEMTRRRDNGQRFCRMGRINDAVTTWLGSLSPQDREGWNVLMGIHSYSGEPGWRTNGSLAEAGARPWMLINDGNLGRPLTAGAHELGHAFGLPHAHNASCSVEQVGEPWPNDFRGQLQGVAWDGTTLRGETDAAPLFDFMSYCAGEANGWVSPRNWNRVMSTLQAFDARQRGPRANELRAESQAGGGVALGLVGPSGAAITRIVATPPEALQAPDPASPVRVRALGSGGQVLAETPIALRQIGEEGAQAGGASSFAVALPAGTTGVEVLSDGAVTDQLVRSRPPVVRLRAPKAGTRVRGTLDVRWTASDPDGDPLQVQVEYAANGRSGWRTVYSGTAAAGAGRARVPARFLDASDRGRVRVTVTDRFLGRARAVSGPIRAAGTPPIATIARPLGGEDLQEGVPLLLVGSALDDRQKALRGRSLTWFAGDRRLGTGTQLRTTLPAGRVRLRLQARDRLGRVTTVSRRVRVTPTPLRLVALSSPDGVRAGARTVTVRIATSATGLLRAGGRAQPVGPRTRALQIPLPARPKRGVLTVPLRITAPGRPAITTQVVVVRN